VDLDNNLDQRGWSWVGFRLRFSPHTTVEFHIRDCCTLHLKGYRELLDEWVCWWECEKTNNISGLVVVDVYGGWKKTSFGIKNIIRRCFERSGDLADGSILDLLKHCNHVLLTIPPNFRILVCYWDDTELV